MADKLPLWKVLKERIITVLKLLEERKIKEQKEGRLKNKICPRGLREKKYQKVFKYFCHCGLMGELYSRENCFIDRGQDQ